MKRVVQSPDELLEVSILKDELEIEHVDTYVVVGAPCSLRLRHP